MNIGLVGYGYWGPNIARNIIYNSGFKLACICDNNQNRLELAHKHYPFIPKLTNIDDLISNPEIDCIVIATNPTSHYTIALNALKNHKHVLVEKPLSTSLSEINSLEQIAKEQDLTLMVDHTFLYNGVVQEMKSLIDNQEIGNIKYIDTTRINLGIFQNDVNVLWDLATHDLSIVNYLLQKMPKSIIATGKCHIKAGIQNIAYLNLMYDDDTIVHVHSSWMSPVKIRLMLIGGDKKMMVYNDIEPTEKLKVYDTGLSFDSNDKDRILVDYRVGDVNIPKYSTKEPLASMIQDFEKSIIHKTKPISGIESAKQIVKILSAAQTSLDLNGKEILI
jgi:predicted dehydrogenase